MGAIKRWLGRATKADGYYSIGTWIWWGIKIFHAAASCMVAWAFAETDYLWTTYRWAGVAIAGVGAWVLLGLGALLAGGAVWAFGATIHRFRKPDAPQLHRQESHPPPSRESVDTSPERRLGHFGPIEHEIQVLDLDQGDGMKRQQVTRIDLPFTFLIRADAVVVRTSVRIRRPNTTANSDLIGTYAWKIPFDGVPKLPKDIIKIRIIYIGTERNVNYYGDLVSYPRPSDGCQYLFTTDVVFERFTETSRLYVKLPIDRHVFVQGSTHYEGDRFFVIEEQYSPFNDGRFDLSLNDAFRLGRRAAFPGHGSGPHGTLG